MREYLKTYLKRFNVFYDESLSKAAGFVEDISFRVFNEAYVKKTPLKHYDHLLYEKSTGVNFAYDLDRVFSLLRVKATTETFNLTLNDLLMMDMSSFDMVEDMVREIEAEHSKISSNIAKEFEKGKV